MTELAKSIVGTQTFFEDKKKGQKCISINQVVKGTAHCFSVSVRTIHNVCKKVQEGEEFMEWENRNKFMAVSKDFIAYVRGIIIGMYKEKTCDNEFTCFEIKGKS